MTYINTNKIDIRKKESLFEEHGEKAQFAVNLFIYDPLPKFIVSLEKGIIKEVNQKAIEILRSEKSNIIGNSINDFFPNLFEQITQKNNSNTNTLSDNLLIEFLNLNSIIYYYKVSVSYINYDVFGYLIISLSDITTFKNAKKELKETKELLEETSQISNIGGWEFNTITKKLNITKVTLNIIEIIDKEELEFRTAYDFFIKGTEKKNLLGLICQSIIEGKSFECEAIIKTTHGNIKWVLINGKAEIKNDKVVRLFGTISDITNKKLLENERIKLIDDLSRNNNELLQFSYIVSHNLRAPVANIIGLINLLKKSNGVTLENIYEMLMNTSLNLDQVIYDINEILSLRNKLKVYKEIYFNEVFETILAMLDHPINESNTLIETDFSQLQSIISVNSLIQSIFYNLISNSIKYRKPNEIAKIKIKTHFDDKFYLIEFSDNGIGIDLSKYKNKIFGLYQRFNFSTPGKGMGLHIVKTSISTLDGQIEVTSELNIGTTFIIKLPKYLTHV